MFRTFQLLIASMVVAASVAATARAEILDGVFAFEAIDISHGPCDPFGQNCLPPPVDPVRGSFRIDVNTADAGSVGPVTGFVSNLPGVTGPFTYIMEGSAFPTLLIGNDCDMTTCFAAAGRNDMFIVYSVLTPQDASLTYTLASGPEIPYGSPYLTLTEVVPEPPSIALAALGCLAALTVARVRTRARPTAARRPARGA